MHRSLKVNFANFSKADNNGHVRAKVHIAYAGDNRNYSRISKEAFEKAIESLKNIPVVGNWLGKNFGGHDMILEERGNELVIKDATTPFGVVPEDCNPRWESIEDGYGNTKEYFTCDVVLWHERYPEQVEFIKENGVNQSMEIMVTEGDFDEKDNYFNIDEFYYSALCLLGIDAGDDGNVEPAFEDSKVTVFKLDTKFEDKFKKFIKEETKEDDVNMEFKEMYEELKAKFEAFEEEVEDDKSKEQEEKDKLEEEIKELEARIEELEEELSEYEAEKVKAEKEEVVEEYEGLLDEEVVSGIVADIDELSVDELDFKLAKAVADSVKEKKAKEEEEAKGERFRLETSNPKPADFSFASKFNM